jgi:hypothetical protein
LPATVQAQADRAYLQLRDDPRHPFDWNLKLELDFGQGALNRFAEEALAHLPANRCRER